MARPKKKVPRVSDPVYFPNEWFDKYCECDMCVKRRNDRLNGIDIGQNKCTLVCFCGWCKYASAMEILCGMVVGFLFGHYVGGFLH